MQDEKAYQDEIKNIVSSAMRDYGKQNDKDLDISSISPIEQAPSPRSTHKGSLAFKSEGKAYV